MRGETVEARAGARKSGTAAASAPAAPGQRADQAVAREEPGALRIGHRARQHRVLERHEDADAAARRIDRARRRRRAGSARSRAPAAKARPGRDHQAGCCQQQLALIEAGTERRRRPASSARSRAMPPLRQADLERRRSRAPSDRPAAARRRSHRRNPAMPAPRRGRSWDGSVRKLAGDHLGQQPAEARDRLADRQPVLDFPAARRHRMHHRHAEVLFQEIDNRQHAPAGAEQIDSIGLAVLEEDAA